MGAGEVAKMSRAEALARASQLVADVIQTLDRSESKCASCELSKKANWTEHQAALELESVVNKLAKWAQCL